MERGGEREPGKMVGDGSEGTRDVKERREGRCCEDS